MQPILKLVILDRDGTINEDRDDYVKSPDEWVPLPGALEAMARLNHAGWHTVVATNQSGIGRGLFDMAALNAMHAHKMNQLLHGAGRAHRRGVLLPAHARGRLRLPQAAARACSQQIGERYGVDLREVPMVGDTLRDLQAGAGGRLRAAPGAQRQGGARSTTTQLRAAASRRCPARWCTPTSAASPQYLLERERMCAATPTRPTRLRALRLMARALCAAALGAVRAVDGRSRWCRGRWPCCWSRSSCAATPLYWMCVGWLRLAIWGARVICGVRYRVHGHGEPAHRARAASAVLLASKHQSTWETFAFPTLMPHPLAYVFKRELLLHPVLRLGDGAHGHDPHRPQQARRGLEQGGRAGRARCMAQGNWVIMFPEGTRSAARPARARTRSAARGWRSTTGTPVVPIAVTSARCWPRKSFLLRPGVIDISIGKPIAVRRAASPTS